MTENNFLDRFKIHLNSFQEGFDILAESNTLEELAKNLCHILRGNILVKGAGIYYKRSGSGGWIELCNLVPRDGFDLNTLNSFNGALSVIDGFPLNGNILMIIPMLDDSAFAVILDDKLTGEPFSSMDKLTLQLFNQLLNNAYQAFKNRKKEKQLIFTLNHKVLQLNSLIDTGIEIAKISQDFSLYELALERAASMTNASKALLFVDDGSGSAEKYYFPGEFKIEESEEPGFRIEADFKFKNTGYHFLLLNKESREGYIPFEETDKLLLDAFGRQVLGAVENRYLHQEELEKQKIEQELSVAGSIQRKIIPDRLPEIVNYDLAGINIPSKEVGGDYYDCKQLKDGRYAMIIADVSGKGVPAALLVSSLNASLNPYFESGLSLSEIAFRINKLIFSATPPDKYITSFLALLTPQTGDLEILNAGHNPIYLLTREKEIKELTKGGLSFGMFDMDVPYDSENIIMKPGDRLLLYTDGIPEAMNMDEEVYSDETLIDFFREKNFENAGTFINELIKDIKRHTGNTPQSDDITALYLTRLA